MNVKKQTAYLPLTHVDFNEKTTEPHGYLAYKVKRIAQKNPILSLIQNPFHRPNLYNNKANYYDIQLYK